MQGNLFYGCGTALATPFRGNRIDFDALENLIDEQIDADIDALVVLGTTGEPETITDAERSAIIECALARCARRVPMIVGAGANDTRTAIRRAVEAQMLGADALLVVTPYYNRASNQGLIEHYTAVADRVEIPIIMYNVPSRTRRQSRAARRGGAGEAPDALRAQGRLRRRRPHERHGAAVRRRHRHLFRQRRVRPSGAGAGGARADFRGVERDPRRNARADDELDPRRREGLPQPRVPLGARCSSAFPARSTPFPSRPRSA